MGHPAISTGGRCEGLYYLIHAWLELCDGECLLEKWKGSRIAAHCLIVFGTSPLSDHCDLCSVEAAMESGGDKSCCMSHRHLGCAGQEIGKALLVLWIDCEYVDQRDLLVLGVVIGPALLLMVSLDAVWLQPRLRLRGDGLCRR